MHLGQRNGAVRRIVDIIEAELPLQIADDTDHGAVIVHHEYRYRSVDSHSSRSVGAGQDRLDWTLLRAATVARSG
jgi:hypothetical protein